MIKYLLVVIGRWRTAVLSWRNLLLLAPHPPASFPIGFFLITLGRTAAAGNVRRLKQDTWRKRTQFPSRPRILDMKKPHLETKITTTQIKWRQDSLLPWLPRFQLLCWCHCGGRWQQSSQHSPPHKHSTDTRPQTYWIMEALRHHHWYWEKNPVSSCVGGIARRTG